jgi:hypothetical protein
MSITPLIGRPGISSGRTAQYRTVFKSADFVRYYENGGVLDGTLCRDGDNTDNVLLLRPGVLMGKVTSSKKWAPSVIGVTKTSALTSTGTSVTINAAQAVELARRVGSTGTFKLTGPPVASGTVRTLTATYSAINTTTGAVTITALGVNEVQTVALGATMTAGSISLAATHSDGSRRKVKTAWNTSWTQTVADLQTAINAELGTSAVALAVTNTHDMTVTFSGTNYQYLPQDLVTVEIASATSVTLGDVTRTTAGVDGRFIVGSFVQPTDGSESPLSVIADGYGVLMAVDSSDVDWPQLPVQGPIVGSQLLPAWPSDTSLQAWIKGQLCTSNGGPRFSFDDVFAGA